MTDERDPVVREALDRIPAPPAEPEFWDRLDARLAQADAPERLGPAAVRRAERSAGPEEDLTVVPLARRRVAERRRSSLVLAAAAAVVLALLITWRVTTDESGQTASRPDPVTTTVPASVSDANTPERSLDQWLDALSRGDVQAAATRTGPRTIAYEEANSGRTVEEFLLSYGEPGSWGDWASKPDRSFRAVSIGQVDGQAAQVVVATSGDDTDAFPMVRSADGTWLVEINAFDPEVGGRIDIASPLAGESGLQAIAAGDPIDLDVSVAGTYVVAVDGHHAIRHEVTSPSAAATVRFDATDGLAPGEHTLVVAVVNDRLFTAIAVPLNVSG